MSKPLHGFAGAGIVTAIALMVLGGWLYPEFSRDFKVFWMLLTGMIIGGITGIILRSTLKTGIGIAVGISTGTLGFLFFALLLSLPLIKTAGTGICIGGVNGAYIQLWAQYRARVENKGNAH